MGCVGTNAGGGSIGVRAGNDKYRKAHLDSSVRAPTPVLVLVIREQAGGKEALVTVCTDQALILHADV